MSLDNSQSNSFEESLSALMDNEADDLELRRLLKALPGNTSLTETWRRFHETRSMLHNEEVLSLSPDACNRIFDAIAAEPVYKPVCRETVGAPAENVGFVIKARWWESAGRVAIAASVALAAFVGLQSTLFSPVPEQALVEQQAAPVSANQLVVVENSGSFDAQAQQRLDDYIRSVSIQNREEAAGVPQFNILQDSQLIRQVNQIEN